jgi:hypothetical protein
MRALSSVLLPWWEADVEEGERSCSFYGEKAGVRVRKGIEEYSPSPQSSPTRGEEKTKWTG